MIPNVQKHEELGDFKSRQENMIPNVQKHELGDLKPRQENMIPNVQKHELGDFKPRQENMTDKKYYCIVGHKQTDGTKWEENKLFYKKIVWRNLPLRGSNPFCDARGQNSSN
jgi:hypothetical protein